MPSRKLTPEELALTSTPKSLGVESHTSTGSVGLAPPPEVMSHVLRPKLDPAGAANPSIASANNAVRHRIRDGVPTLDTTPVAFNQVRLEDLTDQIPTIPTPIQALFQVRFEDVPTQRYMNAHVVPGTLVAYVDGSWSPTSPVVDVDANGNFTLPMPPVFQLYVSYAWQYLSDGEINQFIDEGRQWLREFQSVSLIPDGLVPALISYASARALQALQRSAILAPVKAGDSDIDWSALAKAYKLAATDMLALARQEREDYYTQGPEAKDPTVVDVFAPFIPSYTPER